MTEDNRSTAGRRQTLAHARAGALDDRVPGDGRGQPQPHRGGEPPDDRDGPSARGRRAAELAAVFDAVDDGILICDVADRCLVVNRAACDLLGVRREEALIGVPFATLVAPDDRETLCRLRVALRERGAGRCEVKLRADGDLHLTTTVAISARLGDERCVYTLRDLSAQKRVEAGLARARAEIETLARTETEATEAFEVSPQRGLQTALKAIALQAQALTDAELVCIKLGGDERQTSEVLTWVAVGEDDDARRGAAVRSESVERLLSISTRDGRVTRTADADDDDADDDDADDDDGAAAAVRVERRLRCWLSVPIVVHGRTEGALLIADKRTALDFDDDDERVGHVLAARAASAFASARIYQGEAAQRAWLESVLEQMPEAVTVYDEDGQVLLENRTAQAQAALSLCSPNGAALPPHETPLFRALRRGETVAGVELALRGGGDGGGDSDGNDVLPILLSAAPISANGSYGAITIAHDIRVLKELERLREEWASIVAHDLRQPVTAIQLAVEGLLKQQQQQQPQRPPPPPPSPPPQQQQQQPQERQPQRARVRGAERRQVDALQRIRSSAQRLHHMINDLLQASIIEARRLTIRPQPTDVAAVATSVAAAVGEAHGASITVRSGGGPSETVLVDPERLEQVLLNLVTNAVKYGDAERPDVVVDVQRRSDEVVIGVTNRGAGIPASELPLLFSRFARTKRARTSGAAGLGLGLYIARGLVEAHGGKLTAESTPGELTTFRVFLPAAAAAAAAAAATATAAPTLARGAGRRSPS